MMTSENRTGKKEYAKRVLAFNRQQSKIFSAGNKASFFRVQAQDTQVPYFIRTPHNETYAITGNPDYNWAQWFENCNTTLIKSSAKVGKAFWYVGAPGIGLYHEVDTPVVDFPPDLLCLKNSPPPTYITPPTPAPTSVPFDAALFLKVILGLGTVGIFAGYLFYSYSRRLPAAQQPILQAREARRERALAAHQRQAGRVGVDGEALELDEERGVYRFR